MHPLLAELTRVLAPDGILAGSVPTADYEQLCEEVYGKNPYHLTRTGLPELIALLAERYAHYEVYTISMEIGSLTRTIASSAPAGGHAAPPPEIPSSLPQHGVYFFFATRMPSERWRRLLAQTPERRWQHVMNMAEYDAETVMPIVHGRDDRFADFQRMHANMERMIRERDAEVQKGLVRIGDYREAHDKMQRLIEERDAYIRELEAKVDALRGS